jgi:hypothetical protein
MTKETKKKIVDHPYVLWRRISDRLGKEMIDWLAVTTEKNW